MSRGTAWDLGTAYSSKSLSVATELSSLRGLEFSGDGTKVYAVSTGSDTIYQYTLSTAWDISTASYASKSLSVTSQDTDLVGVRLSSDGTTALVMGSANDKVFQYTLATAWDISTASYASKSVSVVGESHNAFDVSPDGTRMFVGGRVTGAIASYTMSTAWDVSTATADSITLDVTPQDTIPNGVVFSPDGYYLIIAGESNKKMFEYVLDTAWDVSTARYEDQWFYMGDQDIYPHDVRWSSDGLHFYVAGDQYDTIYEYDTAVPWRLHSVQLSGRSVKAHGGSSNHRGLALSSDGLHLYWSVQYDNRIYQLDLTTANDLSTGDNFNQPNSMSISAQTTNPKGAAVSSDGTKLYVFDDSSDVALQYTLSTAYDITTGSYASKSMSVTTQATSPKDLTFSADGTKCYVTDNATDTIYQYTLSTAWDISTGSYASKSLSVSAHVTVPEGIAFSSDGKTVFVHNATSDAVHQYDLSTAWDISTGSYSGKAIPLDFTLQDSQGIAIASDGTRFFALDSAARRIYDYSIVSYILSGTVNDPSGNTISGAVIRATNTTAGVPAKSEIAVSDSSGAYSVPVFGFSTDTYIVYGSVAGPPRRFGASDDNLTAT